MGGHVGLLPYRGSRQTTDSLIILRQRVMAPYAIPEDVRRFLLKHIDSIAHLEALLLMRESPEMDWSIPAVAARLYVTPEEVTPLLSRLCEDGFIIMTESPAPLYRYRPSTTGLAGKVDRTAKEYAKHLVPITKLIHDKPRMRVQEFADAFRFRKDPP